MAAKGIDYVVGAACSEPELTTNGYIQHHLTNLTYGKLPYDSEVWHCNEESQLWDMPTIIPADTWTFAHGASEAADMGFWAFNVDSIGWSSFNFKCLARSGGWRRAGAFENRRSRPH